jgi:hypothetical protein
MHHHRPLRRGEDPGDLSGLGDGDDSLRHLQERRGGQELVGRSTQGSEHISGGHHLVRAKGSGSPRDVFLQPQGTVARRSWQEGTNIVFEQLG